MTADTAAAVDARLAALACTLQPGLAALPVEMQTERAVAWLAGRGGWLPVLDNVEDPVHIRPLLDRIPGGRVLVTSRRATGWHRHATTVRLGVLEAVDATALFTRILTHQGPRETDGAEELCAELGYLALAVEQAAAYCAETGTSPIAYLDILAKWPAAMFAAAAEGGDPERAVARIWRITLDRLTAITPWQGTSCGFWPGMPPRTFPAISWSPFGDPPALATAIGRLVAYSMVTDLGDGTVILHRLVRAHSRTSDQDDPHRQADAIDRARDKAAELLAQAFPADGERPANWPRYRALLPHVEALTRHHTPDHDTLHTARALDRATRYQVGQGVLALTIEAFRRALSTRERLLGTDHPYTLTSRNNLAYAYQSAGDLAQAVPLYERTLADAERVLGSGHPLIALVRGNLESARSTR
ncbi:tetratricopeptide repeat protein [Streptomyces sp. NPDC056488]|uniref:tetratricopeptide repeat protein n=1 Tax=Streptomyces sp. NPDC056488 TaxID=3345836 RepID=UPI0036C1C01B